MPNRLRLHSFSHTLALLVPSLVAFLLVGCNSSTVSTSTGPSPIKCQVVLTPIDPIVAVGGSGSITVSAAPECAWDASVNVSWITLTPSSGQGIGAIQVQVTPNPGSSVRQGEITLNGVKVAVSQSAASCTFDIAPRSETVPTTGGTGSVTVTTLSGCAWTSKSDVSWLSVTAGASGNGPGTVRFSGAPNTGPARAGTIVIADQSFVVTQQAPGAPCAYTIQPVQRDVTPSGGTTVVAVDAAATCSWTAATNVGWLSVVGAATGVGKGSVTINAASNVGAPRIGTVTIAGQAFTVNQAGSCASTVSPPSASVAAAGGAGPSVTVTIAAGCAWTATSSAPWLTITSGPGGTGNGTVAFNVTANTGALRTGTLIIAGRTFTVTQAGAAACALTINPTSHSAGAAGGAGPTVTVTGAAHCAWTATTPDSWISITPGSTGAGNGTVNFTVAANAGSARSGTLIIAGHSFTVTQAGAAACAFTINPTSHSAGAAGGAGPAVAVTGPASCAWTATSPDPWITITSGSSGAGNGTVTFAVDANAGSARSGILIVAGHTFTVTQAGACIASLAPVSQSIAAAAGPGTPVAVTIPAGCAWTATTAAPWIAITDGASDTGNGVVQFSTSVNTGAERTGTIVAAGQTHTVTQAPGCSVEIAPASVDVPMSGATGLAIAVTAPNGCAWTASTSTPWITITQNTGNGNGSVIYNIEGALLLVPRTGTVLVADKTFTVNQSALLGSASGATTSAVARAE